MNNTSILSPIQITSILINNVCTNVPSESHWWLSVHCLPCTSKAAGSDAIKAASWSQFSEWLDSGDFILGVCVLGSRKVEGGGRGGWQNVIRPNDQWYQWHTDRFRAAPSLRNCRFIFLQVDVNKPYGTTSNRILLSVLSSCLLKRRYEYMDIRRIYYK